jgi:hypothetical protein
MNQTRPDFIFDIETGPLPDEELKRVFEVDLGKVKDRDLIDQEFDPATVRLGGRTNPEKVAEWIESRRVAFESRRMKARNAIETACNDQWAAFKGQAALSAITGQVLVIGVGAASGGEPGLVDGCGDERAILCRFWEAFGRAIDHGTRLIGFNIFGFDLPLLIHRSWWHGVAVPEGVLRENRYWSPVFVDLMQVWGCGVYGSRIKLDKLARFFGLPTKTGSGADFARLWFGTPEEHQQAIDYAKRDIEVTRAVAARMGVIETNDWIERFAQEEATAQPAAVASIVEAAGESTVGAAGLGPAGEDE